MAAQWAIIQNSTAWYIITNFLDILIVGYVIYRILLLLRGTRAVQLIKGIVILIIAAAVSSFLGLSTINWILNQLWAMIFIALAIIFQPELRRALEQLGRGRFFMRSPFGENGISPDIIMDKVIAAVISGAKTKTGMLIVIEQQTGLNDYIENGITLDAVISTEFLVNIFVPNTPLHDGAAIIRGDRLVAAACFLPLSDNPYISSALGTRHRAALGLSEVSDAIVIIVSEETGSISVAKDSKLVRSLDEKTLRKVLREAMLTQKEETVKPTLWKRRGKNE